MRQNLAVSNHTVTCKVCLKNAVIASNKCVGGCVGVGMRVCMCGVCVGGVVRCEGVSVGMC